MQVRDGGHIGYSAIMSMSFDFILHLWLYLLTYIDTPWSMHHYFWRCGYANYLLLSNGGIQPMYIVYSVSLLFLCYILGTTSRFVGIAYHIVQLCMYGSFILFLLPFIYFLYGVEAGVLYTDTYMYLRRMGLAGRFSNGVYICMLLLVT